MPGEGCSFTRAAWTLLQSEPLKIGPMTVDYRKMLMAYMLHVVDGEGIHFLPSDRPVEQADIPGDFEMTPEELATFTELRDWLEQTEGPSARSALRAQQL